jgi:hypothetical protein
LFCLTIEQIYRMTDKLRIGGDLKGDCYGLMEAPAVICLEGLKKGTKTSARKAGGPVAGALV